MVGKSDGVQIEAEGMPAFLQWLPNKPFDWIARHAIDFWLTSEDCRARKTGFSTAGGRVHLDLTLTNMEGHRRLRNRLRDICDKVDIHPHLIDRTLYLGQNTPIGGTAHQAGTMRFGTNPKSSVLDLDCKAHELDNLYVVDASFFHPSVQ